MFGGIGLSCFWPRFANAQMERVEWGIALL